VIFFFFQRGPGTDIFLGYGYHGDFITGWESADFLQNAVDTCTNPSGQIEDCPLFNIQDDSTAAQCSFNMPKECDGDDIEGPREGLAVNVPIQYGPEYASVYGSGAGSAPASSAAGSAPASSAAAPEQTSASSAIVPTLTYSSATASITDRYGGGILVANAHPSDSSATSAAPDSTITVAPSGDVPADGANVVATSTMTQNGEVLEMVIEEVNVTVTATATQTPNAMGRRHLQQHQHRRVRHNGH